MTHLTRLFGIACLLTGCATEPAKDVVLAPDSRYPTWYQETVQCSGKGGDYGRIRWWVLEDDSPNAGETWGRDVYIKLRYATSAFVVKHEMLHTLLGGDAHHIALVWRTCGLMPPHP